MTQENPGADIIEKDIVQTQNQISDTVNELQEKLQPQQLLRQVVGDPQQVPGQLFDAVKRNPFAAGLIGVGALWLLSGKEAKMPGFKRSASDAGYDNHLASITRYEGEEDETYQDRLDTARASYLGVERGNDEAPHSFRERLNSLTQGLREKASSLGGGNGNPLNGFGAAIKERGQGARRWSVAKHDEAPLAVAIAAAAAGALAGLALPKTQLEREKLAPLRDGVVAKASELKDQALEAARTKLDQGQLREASTPEMS